MTEPAAGVTLVAVLTVRAGRELEFEAFERRAAAIMAEHGGRIERVVRESASTGAGAVREIHIVTFPAEAAFAAYRDDARLAALAEVRASVISETLLIAGRDLPPP